MITASRTNILAKSDKILVTAQQLGQWLNLSPSAVSRTACELEELEKTAIELIEKYTWLNLIRKTFQAEFVLDSWSSICRWLATNECLSLENGPIIDIADITKVEYLDENDQYVEWLRGPSTEPGLYEKTTERIDCRDWAVIYLREEIPFKNRINAVKIRITFTAGFSEESGNIKAVPSALLLAIKQIVAYFFTNRGDCDSKCSIGGIPIPCVSKGILDRFSVARTVLGGSIGSSYGACR